MPAAMTDNAEISQLQRPGLVPRPSIKQDQSVAPSPRTSVPNLNQSYGNFGPLSMSLPPEQQMMLGPSLNPNDPFHQQLMGGHTFGSFFNFDDVIGETSVPNKFSANFHPSFAGMNATLAPSALDLKPTLSNTGGIDSSTFNFGSDTSFGSFNSMPMANGGESALPTPGLNDSWDQFINDDSAAWTESATWRLFFVLHHLLNEMTTAKKQLPRELRAIGPWNPMAWGKYASERRAVLLHNLEEVVLLARAAMHFTNRIKSPLFTFIDLPFSFSGSAWFRAPSGIGTFSETSRLWAIRALQRH
jgi:hypothetical protein